MRHIEEDRCPKIDRVVLVQEQSRKYLVKAALKAHEENPLFPLREDADDSEGGGVKLSSLELENREAIMNQPKPVDNKDNDDDNDTNSDAANMHWPKLGDSRKATPNDLTDFNKLSVKDDSENGTDKGKARADSTSQPKGPWNRETPKKNAPGQTKGSFGLDPVPNIGSTLRTLNEKWDPTAFFNSFTGFYDCPCGGSYGNMQEFQEHVLKKTRARRSVQYDSLNSLTCGFRRYFSVGIIKANKRYSSPDALAAIKCSKLPPLSSLTVNRRLPAARLTRPTCTDRLSMRSVEVSSRPVTMKTGLSNTKLESWICRRGMSSVRTWAMPIGDMTICRWMP